MFRFFIAFVSWLTEFTACTNFIRKDRQIEHISYRRKKGTGYFQIDITGAAEK